MKISSAPLAAVLVISAGLVLLASDRAPASSADLGPYVVCVTTIDAGGRERPDSYYQLAQDARRRQWQIITEGWGPTMRSPYDPGDPGRSMYPTDSYPTSAIIKATVDWRGDGDVCPPDPSSTDR